MKENRLKKVLDRMQEMGCQQALISDPMSIYYLTGRLLDPGERFYALYLRSDGKHLIFINELFTVEEDLGVEKVRFSDTDDVISLVAERMMPSHALGVDKDLPARFLLPLMDTHAAVSFVNVSAAVDLTRGCKDAEEIERMKRASAINDEAMAQFQKLIRPGVTEEAVARQMLEIYRRLGAEDYSFDPLVAFGANAAEGHHAPDATVLQEGDCVLFDVGCRKDMYCADMTRTFFYRCVSDAHRKVYELVQKANETAISVLKPGMPLKEVDAAARDLITQAGYGKYFTHRLGHFIGLNVHEYGDVSAVNDRLTQPGMIFSIEPGVYLPGDVGVRVEDLVVVTDEGCERLNHFDKNLQIL